MTANTTTKVANYTEAQTAELVSAYTAISGESVETRDKLITEYAVKFGKSVRSIRAKLSNAKVYIAKEYVGKTGEKPVKKDAHADAIGAVLNLSENEIESLTKANKTALVKIFAALANSKPL